MRDRIEVGTYRAPGARRPARPAGLRVRRGRSALTVTWRAVKGAPRYQAAVRLSSGRRALVTTKRRRVVLRGISRGTSGAVKLRALSAAGMTGPAAVANVRPTRSH